MLHIEFRRAYHAVLQLVVPPRDGAAGPKLIQGPVIHTDAAGRITRAGQNRAFGNALEELRGRFDAGDPEVTRFFTASRADGDTDDGDD
ncbi:hypothetical protein [Saccharothrix sp.]|uniref:hypothetical protein n=1 Tax=Saccharothrix sp. TaxID=1873460 RepID=UPI002810B27F|nr:hypothetical protein [Saccharothrix sp.]